MLANSEELMNNCRARSAGTLPQAMRDKSEGVSALGLEQAERLGRAVLRERVEQLQSRERLRAEWTAMAVHELRRLLTTIDLSTQLLQEGLPGPEEAVREKLELIRLGIEQLSRVTHDLFDASCIEARAMKIERVSVAIAGLVQDAIAHLPDVAPRCSLRVELGAHVQVSADPGRVEQVLGNLLEKMPQNTASRGPRSRSMSPLTKTARVSRCPVAGQAFQLTGYRPYSIASSAAPERELKARGWGSACTLPRV
jgi:signal transduction histidine kinase